MLRCGDVSPPRSNTSREPLFTGKPESESACRTTRERKCLSRQPLPSPCDPASLSTARRRQHHRRDNIVWWKAELQVLINGGWTSSVCRIMRRQESYTSSQTDCNCLHEYIFTDRWHCGKCGPFVSMSSLDRPCQEASEAAAAAFCSQGEAD